MGFHFFVVGKSTTRKDPNDPWSPSIYTLEDACKPRPAVDYVVKGLFPCPSLSILYGAPGTLKSFQLADLAVCVAGEKLWLEPDNGQQCRSFETKQSGVFWLDFENGPRRTHERFEALALAHGLSTGIPLTYVSMPNTWLDSSDSDSMAKLGERVKRLETKLLIADNLGVISGGVDENSIKMATVMSNWRRLAETYNMAIVLSTIRQNTKRKVQGLALPCVATPALKLPLISLCLWSEKISRLSSTLNLPRLEGLMCCLSPPDSIPRINQEQMIWMRRVSGEFR